MTSDGTDGGPMIRLPKAKRIRKDFVPSPHSKAGIHEKGIAGRYE